MERNRIGLATNDLRLPIRAGLKQAVEIGFGAVEIGAAGAEVNPRELSHSGRRHLGRHVRNLGLTLAALGADPADAGRLDHGNVDQRAAHARAVMELAADMGASLVTVRLGPLTSPTTGPPLTEVRELLEHLADHADRVGLILAVRSAGDDPAEVAGLLRELGCPALRLCLDPAALLLAGRDPAKAVEPVADYLALCHARDAAQESGTGPGRETVLGRGEVDFRAYLNAISEAGYTGPQIIRRSDAVEPIADLAASRDFLASL